MNAAVVIITDPSGRTVDDARYKPSSINVDAFGFGQSIFVYQFASFHQGLGSASKADRFDDLRGS